MRILCEGQNVRIDTIVEFITFAHILNISETSRELNLSQSTLSKHLSDLEKHLGFTLFNRGRQNKLTPAGREFAESALQIIHDYSKVVEKCRKIDVLKSTAIRIPSPIIIDNAMMNLLSFCTYVKSTETPIETRTINTSNASGKSLLINNIVDITTYMSSSSKQETLQYLEKQELIGHYVSSEPLYIWAKEDNSIFNCEKITLDDLADFTIAMPTNESLVNYVDSIKSLFKRYKIRKSFSIHSYDSDLEFFMFTEINDQILLIPESLLHDSHISGRYGMRSQLIEDDRTLFDNYFIHLKEPIDPQLIPIFDRIDDFLSSNRISEAPPPELPLDILDFQ